jgi:hypothetical protein
MSIENNEIRWYRSRTFFFSAFSVLALLHLFIPVLNHYYFRTVAFDFAAYNFAFYDYAHFRISPCPVYHAPYPISFFQDHFSFLLPVLSPLYWVLSPVAGTYSLIFIQWLFILSGAWYTNRLITLKANDQLLGTLAMILYFVLYGRFSAYRADVNLAIMGSAIVPAFLYFFEKRKFYISSGIFLTLLLIREDFALWLFFISLWLTITNSTDKRTMRVGIVYTLASAVYFILCFKILIPAFLEDDYKKYSLFDYKTLGAGPLEAFLYILSHPADTFSRLYQNHLSDNYYNTTKMNFYYLYLISGGFVLLIRPLYLLPFVPLIAKKMFNDNPIRWSVETYYSVEIVSILPIMIFLVLVRLKRAAIRSSIAILTCCCALGTTVYRISTTPELPLLSEDNKNNFLSAPFYKAVRDVSTTNEFISRIPRDAAVTTSARITGHLAFRDKIYLFPRVDDAHYLLVFKRDDTYPLTPDQFSLELQKQINSNKWNVIHNSDDLLFLKRRDVGS